MQPTLVVLAAGMGSRYGGLKQLDAFGPSGETIIDYSVYDAKKAGFGKVVFVIREDLLSDFQDIYFSKYEKEIEIDYVFQEIANLPRGIEAPKERVKPWGTGHAVLVAADKVQEPFAVINADDFYGYESFKIIAEYLSDSDNGLLQAVMVGFLLKNTLSDHGYVSRGICEVDGEGFLKSIKERTKITNEDGNGIFFEEEGNRLPLAPDQVVSMNLMGFTPPAFNLMKELFSAFIKKHNDELKAEFYIPTVLDEIAKKQPVPVLSSHEKWLGVTYKQDKPVVMKKLREFSKVGKYPIKLW